jgi:predicted  nucleic acid-binding Zn-ribbon protein
MNDFSEKMDAVLADLKTQRDELRVKLHLLKAEAKEEWNEVEKSWGHLESRMKQVKEQAAESSEDIGAAGKQLAEEIGRAYQRIRKTLD